MSGPTLKKSHDLAESETLPMSSLGSGTSCKISLQGAVMICTRPISTPSQFMELIETEVRRDRSGAKSMELATGVGRYG